MNTVTYPSANFHSFTWAYLTECVFCWELSAGRTSSKDHLAIIMAAQMIASQPRPSPELIIHISPDKPSYAALCMQGPKSICPPSNHLVPYTGLHPLPGIDGWNHICHGRLSDTSSLSENIWISQHNIYIQNKHCYRKSLWKTDEARSSIPQSGPLPSNVFTILSVCLRKVIVIDETMAQYTCNFGYHYGLAR